MWRSKKRDKKLKDRKRKITEPAIEDMVNASFIDKLLTREREKNIKLTATTLFHVNGNNTVSCQL